MKSDKITRVFELKDWVNKFIEDRDWSKYHNPKDIAISIAIEAAELLELFQWVKENEPDQIINTPSKSSKLQEELADIIIYCMSLANVLSIDVSQAVTKKIEKNKQKYPIDRIKGDYKKYTDL